MTHLICSDCKAEVFIYVDPVTGNIVYDCECTVDHRFDADDGSCLDPPPWVE